MNLTSTRCSLWLFLAFLHTTFVSGAPANLSGDEKIRYERGLVLNKEIALNGLDRLRHYKARVVSIKPAGGGAVGTEIELRAQTILIQESGKPWFQCKEQPIPPRTLLWHWPDSRPLPVRPGFLINAYADAEDRVHRMSLEPGISEMGIYIVALRRINSDARWEVCVATYDAEEKKSFLVIQPDYLNMEDRVFQIEWSAKYGLALSNFRVKFAEGDEGHHETERQAKNWPGWPLANVAGKYVRPGRDGWKSFWTVVTESNDAWQDGKMIRLIPASQYVGTSEVYASYP